MTVLGNRYSGTDLVAGAAAFTMAYGIGNLAGPALGGGAMDAWGPIGLPLAIGGACLVFVAVAAVRALAAPTSPSKGGQRSSLGAKSPIEAASGSWGAAAPSEGWGSGVSN